jgi:hypothetical protein
LIIKICKTAIKALLLVLFAPYVVGQISLIRQYVSALVILLIIAACEVLLDALFTTIGLLKEDVIGLYYSSFGKRKRRGS